MNLINDKLVSISLMSFVAGILSFCFSATPSITFGFGILSVVGMSVSAILNGLKTESVKSVKVKND